MKKSLFKERRDTLVLKTLHRLDYNRPSYFWSLSFCQCVCLRAACVLTHVCAWLLALSDSFYSCRQKAMAASLPACWENRWRFGYIRCL